VAEDESVETAEEATQEGSVYCRHCGEENATVNVEANPDWFCTHCEHYQDSMACPTCHSIVRASLMPENTVPAAARPKRAKK
jgi:hypothetical protein